MAGLSPELLPESVGRNTRLHPVMAKTPLAGTDWNLSMTTTQTEPTQPLGSATPYAGIGLGVATISAAAILIRLAQASTSSLVIAAWRLTIATVILTPVVMITRRKELKHLSRRDWFMLILSGCFLTIHFAAWISSLAYTTVAAAVVLVSTNPIFVALASHFVFHEKLTRNVIIGLVTAIGGSVLIGLGDIGNGAHQLLGDLLALTGGVAGAAYLIIGARMRPKMSLLTYIYPVYGTAAVLLMGVVLLVGLPVMPGEPAAWVWLLLMALGPQIVGHSMVNWSLKYLSATFVTIAILGEPIGSSILAWWLLDEKPTPMTILGGVLILGGIALASLAGKRRGSSAR